MVPVVAVLAPLLAMLAYWSIWGIAERSCGEPIVSRSCLHDYFPSSTMIQFTTTPAFMAVAAVWAAHATAPSHRDLVSGIVLLLGAAATLALVGVDWFAVAAIGPGLAAASILWLRERCKPGVAEHKAPRTG
ncbi:hypothetical protein D0B54_22860 [Solimonas sp. K1W22B-7]|nr:hypothetical protein D0B54_22860 [Solimonas sp. K1W22B-7]